MAARLCWLPSKCFHTCLVGLGDGKQAIQSISERTNEALTARTVWHYRNCDRDLLTSYATTIINLPRLRASAHPDRALIRKTIMNFG